MYEFKDLARLTLVASVLLGAYAGLDVLSSSAAFLQGPAAGSEFRSAEWFQAITLLLQPVNLFSQPLDLLLGPVQLALRNKLDTLRMVAPRRLAGSGRDIGSTDRRVSKTHPYS